MANTCFYRGAGEFRSSVTDGSGKIVRGSLEKEGIRRVIRGHIGSVKACYDAGLAEHPGASGRVAIQFVISSEGHVRASRIASSTLALPDVEDCVAVEACSWRFPQPHGGGEVLVTYPFFFTPQDGGSSSVAPR